MASIVLLLVFSMVLPVAGLSASETKLDEPSEEEQQIVRAQQALWIARILRQKKEGKQIQDLKVDALNVPVFLVPSEESFRPLVKIKLKFERPGWQLYIGDQTPARPGDHPGEYWVYVYLKSRISELSVQVRGPEGQREKERIFLFAPQAQEFKKVSVLDSMLFYLGGASFVYTQTSFGTFSSITGLLGLSYLSPERSSRFGFLGKGEMTVLTLSSSPVDENPQYIDATLAGTYAFKFWPSPQMRSRWLLGVNFLNVISNGSDFGFSQLWGVDLGLRTDFYQSRRNSFFGELHLVPYRGFTPADERNIRLDLVWTHNFDDLRRLSFGFQFSHLDFTSGREEISVEYLALKLGLSL